MVTIVKEIEVEVNISEFSNSELIGAIYDRYLEDEFQENMSDSDLIQEIYDRGLEDQITASSDLNREELLFLLEYLEPLPYSPLTRNIIAKLRLL